MSEQTTRSDTARRDIAHHLHSYTNAVRHEEVGPLIITEGKGIHVYDEHGKEYIEGMAGLWCTALGFGEEALVEAAAAQMRKLPYYHTFTHRGTGPVVDLAEKLKALAPVPMSKVYFTNSGSEANDTVMKMLWFINNALDRPERKKFISRMKGYHGVTIASGSLTGLPLNHQNFDLPLPGILHADCPHHYRFGNPGESEDQFTTRLAVHLESMIEMEGPETIAAFFAEPVMGAGGVIVPPAGYFEKIQAVLQRYDIPLVADEVICGFGRTGEFWGSQTFGLKPDILVCSKQISSGYLPISAVMISERIYEGLREGSRRTGNFATGFTQSGNPTCAAVSLRNLELYEERGILAHAQSVSPRFQARLREFAGHPLVGDVRGVGLIGGVELVEDKASKKPFATDKKVGMYLAERAVAHGLLLRAIGDTLAFCPPMIITADQVETLFSRFESALEETWKWVQ